MLRHRSRAFLLFTSLACVASAGDFTPVRGDRAGGWLGQTRSEVLARNGIVTTSQPRKTANCFL